MRRLCLLVCGFAFFVVACVDNPVKPTDLKDVTWKLETIERAGSPTITVPNPEQYTLILGNDGHVTVRADCNQCTTTYTVDGSSLKVAHLNCTTNFCTLASLDGNYAASLEGDSSVQISGSHLVIQKGSVTLRFRS
jgi:heat shock protein HslJ